MQDLGFTSDQHYDMGYSYDHRPQIERSASNSLDDNYDRTRQRHNDHGEYSSTDTSEKYYYGTNQFSTTSIEYRDLGYYYHRVDIAQPSPTYYSDDRASNQSLSLPDQTNIHTIIFMKTIYLISLLIVGMITMMIWCIIAIQCENDYIMQIFTNVFCEICYIMHVF